MNNMKIQTVRRVDAVKATRYKCFGLFPVKSMRVTGYNIFPILFFIYSRHESIYVPI